MYIVLFGVGVGFVLISFFLDTLIDIEGGGPLSILQPKLIAVFLTVTGGLGIILSSRLGTVLTLAVSVFIGFFVARLIHRLVIIPLHRAQNTSTFDKMATIGTIAKVISPIRQGGYGKISYNVSGSTVTGPAKSEDGGEIKNGEHVDIVSIDGGTYFVKKQAENQQLGG